MALGSNSSDSNVSKDSDQKWANINFKNPRHPDQSGSADMQRYFDDAEYVKDQFPSRTKIVGELLSGLAQFHRSESGNALDRDDQDDLLVSVTFILTGEGSIDSLLSYVEERAEAQENDESEESSEAEAPADD